MSFWEIAKSVAREAAGELKDKLDEETQVYNKAYEKGCEMDDIRLIKYYISATGSRKLGYRKALEEKGIIEKGSDGKYRASSEYRGILNDL